MRDAQTGVELFMESSRNVSTCKPGGDHPYKLSFVHSMRHSPYKVTVVHWRIVSAAILDGRPCPLDEGKSWRVDFPDMRHRELDYKEAEILYADIGEKIRKPKDDRLILPDRFQQLVLRFSLALHSREREETHLKVVKGLGPCFICKSRKSGWKKPFNAHFA